MMPRSVWEAIVGFAMFSSGLAVYAALLNYKAWQLGDSPSMLFMAGARVGYALLVLSTRRIYEPRLAADWHDWLFVAALGLSSAMLFFLALDLRKRFQHGEWNWLHHGLGNGKELE